MMDTYLTIQQAAKIAHMAEPNLYQLAQVGKIRSVMTQTGEILVSENDLKCQPNREQFAELAGNGIGIGEAAIKYGVNRQTISRWKDRGRIKVIGSIGQKILLDEADVAYEASKYLINNPGRGRRTDKI